MASEPSRIPTLQGLDPSQGCPFTAPAKRINDGDDVVFFLASKAYADLMTFIFQLNTAMLPRQAETENAGLQSAREWKLSDSDVPCPTVTRNLAALLDALGSIIDEAPPDPGPRRFGNASFRKWHQIVQERIPSLLDKYLPPQVLAFKSTSSVRVRAELEAYLVGSFGSSQRLDYGTGHELSFLAFLACIWKLGAFPESSDGDQERGIVLHVFEPYLILVRRLILIYTLEPAGSHGVWGLDDHFFLPYIFGSAQFAPPVAKSFDIPTEGSLADAPHPADVAKLNAVERERKRNMYFSAIGFIFDVKKGPFWEHSPILYDISGVTAGWAKINKGMIKMYNAEVLSKFPVVQHFPFGSLLAWEKDPNAKMIEASVHTSNQPRASTLLSSASNTRPQPALRKAQVDFQSTNLQASSRPTTATAPWQGTPARPLEPGGAFQHTRAPRASQNTHSSAPTRPNKQSATMGPPRAVSTVSSNERSAPTAVGKAPLSPVAPDSSITTRAPWANK